MGSLGSETTLPWVKTPCVYSAAVSRAAGCNIYLKLDNLQPSGSFKSRGIGNLMTRALAHHPAGRRAHFYCVSGGNAGLACATSALALSRPCTVVVPLTTSDFMTTKLRALGAVVHQVGRNFAAAQRHLLRQVLPHDPDAVFVPPFDHPDIWDGAASLVPELRDQMMPAADLDAVVCSVGGGGLFNGLMQGIEAASWPAGRKPHVVAVETAGADSLNASLVANEHVTLPEITSIAVSLGCSRVSAQTWRWARCPNTHSVVVSDADAAMACVRFADDARLLVEVSCGAALAAAYRGDLRESVGKGLSDAEWAAKNVVIIVCGGSGVSLQLLDRYVQEYGPQSAITV